MTSVGSSRRKSQATTRKRVRHEFGSKKKSVGPTAPRPGSRAHVASLVRNYIDENRLMLRSPLAYSPSHSGYVALVFIMMAFVAVMGLVVVVWRFDSLSSWLGQKFDEIVDDIANTTASKQAEDARKKAEEDARLQAEEEARKRLKEKYKWATESYEQLVSLLQMIVVLGLVVGCFHLVQAYSGYESLKKFKMDLSPLTRSLVIAVTVLVVVVVVLMTIYFRTNSVEHGSPLDLRPSFFFSISMVLGAMFISAMAITTIGSLPGRGVQEGDPGLAVIIALVIAYFLRKIGWTAFAGRKWTAGNEMTSTMITFIAAAMVSFGAIASVKHGGPRLGLMMVTAVCMGEIVMRESGKMTAASSAALYVVVVGMILRYTVLKRVSAENIVSFVQKAIKAILKFVVGAATGAGKQAAQEFIEQAAMDPVTGATAIGGVSVIFAVLIFFASWWAVLPGLVLVSMAKMAIDARSVRPAEMLRVLRQGRNSLPNQQPGLPSG